MGYLQTNNRHTFAVMSNQCHRNMRQLSSTNAIYLQVAHYTVTQIATVSAVQCFSNVSHERKAFMIFFGWRWLPSNSRLALPCQVVMHCVEFLPFHWHLRQQLQREHTRWQWTGRGTTCNKILANIHMHTPAIRTPVTIANGSSSCTGG